MTIDLASIGALDTLGTWLLERILRRTQELGGSAEFSGLPERYSGIVEEMRQVNRRPRAPRRPLNPVLAWLDALGRAAVACEKRSDDRRGDARRACAVAGARDRPSARLSA